MGLGRDLPWLCPETLLRALQVPARCHAPQSGALCLALISSAFREGYCPYRDWILAGPHAWCREHPGEGRSPHSFFRARAGTRLEACSLPAVGSLGLGLGKPSNF